MITASLPKGLIEKAWSGKFKNKPTKECKHEIELFFSGGGDLNPLTCCKKCNAIIVQNKPTKEKQPMQTYADLGKKEFIESKLAEFNDFYYETGKYTKRNLGIKSYDDFLTSSLNEAWEKGEKATDEKYSDYAERMNKALFEAEKDGRQF